MKIHIATKVHQYSKAKLRSEVLLNTLYDLNILIKYRSV